MLQAYYDRLSFYCGMVHNSHLAYLAAKATCCAARIPWLVTERAGIFCHNGS